MRRIGITASKIAQGNLLKYNIFVVAISTLCASILLLVSSIFVIVVIFLVSLVLKFVMPHEFTGSWVSVVKTILIILGIFITLLNGLAIAKNIRLTRPKS